MSIADYQRISPNRTSPRNHEIDTITIHCVVGQVTVESLGEQFSKSSRQASSTYGVGKDGRIGQYVPEGDRPWTTGGKDKNGNPIYVNGISGAMNDHRAITIEVASDTFEPYAVNSAAYEGLIRLLVDICKRHPKIHRLRWRANKSLVGNIELQNMTAHRWFAATKCPGDYLYQRFGDIAKEVNKRLDADALKAEEFFQAEMERDDMDVKRFTELWNEMRKDLKDNDAGQWSQEARDWAISSGLIQGSGTTKEGDPNAMWEDLLTREQLVTVLYRFYQIMNNQK